MSSTRSAAVLDYATPPAPGASRWRWVLLSPFLGVSWTWCIGMFLPVLLIRDYGFAGYIIFALPNVIGAAAMGWVIRSPASSHAIVRNHHAAAVAFSIVTIAFHFYFVSWLIRSFWSPLAIPILLGASVAVFLLVNLVKASDRIVSIAAFCISIALICGWVRGGPVPHLVVSHDPIALSALAAACAFGFILCPYLDLTFHRARQQFESPTESKLAFGIGFGAFFFAMIALTPLYAPALLYQLKDGYSLSGNAVKNAIAIHVLMQSSLTIAFHVRELLAVSFERSTAVSKRITALRWLSLPALFLALAAATGLGASMPGGMVISGLSTGEIGYRCFMAFYGLVFPTYVWICIVPKRGSARPILTQWVALIIAMVISIPMFWLGFIEQKMVWILPGVAVAVAMRLVVRERGNLVDESTRATGI